VDNYFYCVGWWIVGERGEGCNHGAPKVHKKGSQPDPGEGLYGSGVHGPGGLAGDISCQLLD